MKTKAITSLFRFKKVAAIILMIVTVIAILPVSGCTTGKNADNSTVAGGANENDYENLIDEQSLYEDESVTLTATKVCFTPESDSEESNTLKIEYTLQNKTKNLFSFTLENVVINGISFPWHIGFDTESGQTGTGKVLIPKELLDTAGIHTIKNIRLSSYYLTDKLTFLTIKPKNYEEDYKEPYDMENPLSTEHGINIEYLGKKTIRPTVKLTASEYLVYKMVNTNDYEIKTVAVNDASLGSNNIKYGMQTMIDSYIPSHGCSLIYVEAQSTPTSPKPNLEGDLGIQFRFFYGDNIDSDFMDSKELKHTI